MRVHDIADMVCEVVPGSRVSFAEGAGPDLRNHRAVRLRRLRELLSVGFVDEMLRRRANGRLPMPGTEIAHRAH